jgi:hypothetical protein
MEKYIFRRVFASAAEWILNTQLQMGLLNNFKMLSNQLYLSSATRKLWKEATLAFSCLGVGNIAAQFFLKLLGIYISLSGFINALTLL